MNPVDIALDLLRPLSPALGRRLAVPGDAVERLVEGAVGGVAAGLVRQADDREGRELVDSLVDGHDRHLLDRLDSHVDEHDDDTDARAILGDKFDGVAAALAAHSGVAEGTAAKALALVAPVLLGLLRRDRATEGIAAPLEAARAALGRPALAWIGPLGPVGASLAAERRPASGDDHRRRGFAVPLLAALLVAVGGVVALGVSLRGDGDDDDRGAAITTPTSPGTTEPDTSATDTDGTTTPDPPSLSGVLAGVDGYANLVAALEAAPDTAEAISSAGAITVFAPDDSALTVGVLADLRKDAAALDATLRYHVVEGTLSEADLKQQTSLTTLSGRRLSVTQKAGRTLVGGAPIARGPLSDNVIVYRIGKVLKPAATINRELGLAPITFETGSAEITPAGKKVLDQAVAFLKETPLPLVIEGHTDAEGEEASNLTLSRRRAVAVRDYLVSQGIRRSLLQAKGFGEARPVASNDTDAGKAQNRRIEFRVR